MKQASNRKANKTARPQLPQTILRACANELARTPLVVLAARYGAEPLDLAAQMRLAGYLPQVTALELQFILRELGHMPHEVIRQQQGFTNSQFDQICQKTLGVTLRRSLHELSEAEVNRKTHWLVEQIVGDGLAFIELPRAITNCHFSEAGLYQCVRFAEHCKKCDKDLRHWPAVAYLVCKAYPGSFQPFEFRHSKTNGYFRGRQGRSRVLQATRFVLVERLGYEPEYLGKLVNTKNFARSADLESFGITAYVYRRFFSSRAELLAEAVKRLAGDRPIKRWMSSSQLRRRLVDAGRDPTRCEVPGCELTPTNVHHILNGRQRSDAIENLIALCLHHHGQAHLIDQTLLIAVPAKARMETVIEHLAGRPHTK